MTYEVNSSTNSSRPVASPCFKLQICTNVSIELLFSLFPNQITQKFQRRGNVVDRLVRWKQSALGHYFPSLFVKNLLYKLTSKMEVPVSIFSAGICQIRNLFLIVLDWMGLLNFKCFSLMKNHLETACNRRLWKHWNCNVNFLYISFSWMRKKISSGIVIF